MKHIYQLHFKVTQYVLNTKSIYQSLFFGLITLLFLIISFLVSNHTAETWSGILGGLAFGIFLIKMQPIVDYFKRNSQKSIN